jgi:hypothetical protein
MLGGIRAAAQGSRPSPLGPTLGDQNKDYGRKQRMPEYRGKELLLLRPSNPLVSSLISSWRTSSRFRTWALFLSDCSLHAAHVSISDYCTPLVLPMAPCTKHPASSVCTSTQPFLPQGTLLQHTCCDLSMHTLWICAGCHSVTRCSLLSSRPLQGHPPRCFSGFLTHSELALPPLPVTFTVAKPCKRTSTFQRQDSSAKANTISQLDGCPPAMAELGLDGCAIHIHSYCSRRLAPGSQSSTLEDFHFWFIVICPQH